MRDFKQDHLSIRRFLLGQLSDDQAQAVEDRIFAEPDFAEEVQIVENELITDFHEGTIAAEERAWFESKYSKDKADRSTLEYEKLFSEFIRSKSEGKLSLGSAKSQPSAATLSRSQISPPPAPLKSTRPSSSPWFQSHFKTHRLVAYATILIFCLLSVTLVWYFVTHRSAQPDNPLGARLQAIEATLARLNTPGAASPEKVLLTVNLQPAERDRGAMARILADNTTPEGLIQFRLSLTEASSQEYRALFLNDRHQELFSISKLTAQRTADGPEIRLVVPAAYLSPGDYQINLSVSNKTGGHDEVNSYAVRVVPGN